MKLSAYTKSVIRSVKDNKIRILVSVFISIVAILFSAGFGGLNSSLKSSFIRNLNNHNSSEFIIKQVNNPTGSFDNELISYIKNEKSINEYDLYYSFDFSDSKEEVYNRIYYKDLKNSLNKLDLIEGNYPSNSNEVLVVHGGIVRKTPLLGDTIKISLSDTISFDVKVSGIVNSPTYSSYVFDEYSFINNKKAISNIIYFSNEYNALGPMPFSPIFNECAFKRSGDILTNKSYEQSYIKYKDKLESDLSSFANIKILGLEDIPSIIHYQNALETIRTLTSLLPIFFVIIAAFACYVSIDRMIKEERKNICCEVILGESKSRIIFKYTAFYAFFVFIGAILGLVIGIFTIPEAVFTVFSKCYALTPYAFDGNPTIGIISILGLVLVVVISCVVMINLTLNEEPYLLVRPKAPKPGKKILLEKITPLWKIIPFKFKMTLKNLMRYKLRTLIYFLAVTGNTALTFIGVNLFYALGARKFELNDPQFNLICEPLSVICGIIVGLAVALCILITFLLIYLNIQDRRLEISTLKVLGYTDFSSFMYSFKESLILNIFGAIAGIPLGRLYLAHQLIDFEWGLDISYVPAYMYFVVFFIIIGLCLLINIFFYFQNKNIKEKEALRIY